jgi:CubicO group peptidase (beta-lactamase class C family)
VIKLVVVFVCVTIIFSASTPQARAEENTLTNPTIQIDTYLSRLTAIGAFSGSVLVSRSDNILFSKGYGLADRDNGIPNTPQTRYILASISKQFIAMTILMLQEQHKLTVGDYVCIYIPDCPRAWKNITLHHLLTHTSGIPDYMSFSDFASQMGLPYSPTQLVGWFRNKPLWFTPGTRWRYSNSGYALLGYIIEQVSGEPLGEFLSENIFEPLQMNDSGYDPDNAVGTDLAIGYDGIEQSDYMDMSVAYAPGGLYATVEDLYRWSNALDANTLLSVKAENLLFKSYAQVPGVPAQSYGYGWFIRKRLNRTVVEHTGVLTGFTTLITRFQKEHLTIIILSNQYVNVDAIANEISRIVLTSN